MFSTEQQTFAAWIGHCKTCDSTDTTFWFDPESGKTRFQKCGHDPEIIIKLNPLLGDDNV